MRYFLTFSYRGTAYCGWQIQPNGITVQAVLQQALQTILRTPIDLVGAGRTDAGVHAKKMIAHFDYDKEIVDCEKIVSKLNGLLPADIAVQKLRCVALDAHARFDATARRYEYHVVQTKNPFTTDLACKMACALDFEKMNQAAHKLLNYNDFTSFSKVHTDVKTMNCTIVDAHWEQRGEEWVFCIEANRFLRNMVRAIVGTLFEVGKGALSINEFCHVIEAKNRCSAGMSVPACGLYLVDVKYPYDV